MKSSVFKGEKSEIQLEKIPFVMTKQIPRWDICDAQRALKKPKLYHKRYKFCAFQIPFLQIMKIPPQNLLTRKTAVVSDLAVFEYLQNSEGSDNLIKNAVYGKMSCDG